MAPRPRSTSFSTIPSAEGSIIGCPRTDAAHVTCPAGDLAILKTTTSSGLRTSCAVAGLAGCDAVATANQPRPTTRLKARSTSEPDEIRDTDRPLLLNALAGRDAGQAGHRAGARVGKPHVLQRLSLAEDQVPQ